MKNTLSRIISAHAPINESIKKIGILQNQIVPRKRACNSSKLNKKPEIFIQYLILLLLLCPRFMVHVVRLYLQERINHFATGKSDVRDL